MADLPEIAGATGLPVTRKFVVGIHDSNASLMPHLLREAPPLSVVSTGTWVIAMAIGRAKHALDPARDTLINANAFGDPVGRHCGRGGQAARSGRGRDADALGGVGIGAVSGAQRATPRRVFYLALMSATRLRLAGHQGRILVESPFARNIAYLGMLGAALGAPVIASGSLTGTHQGATLLLNRCAASMAQPQLHRSF